MYVMAQEQYRRQKTQREQIRTITIVAIVFAITVFLIMFVPNRQVSPIAYTNTLSSAPDSSTSVSSAISQAGRKDTNPFQGFRNVGSPQ
jgi:hypothetical protein